MSVPGDEELDLLTRLPPRIAIHILSMLDAHSLLLASRVSRAWLALSRLTLIHARDYRDSWWLEHHNWRHLSQLAEILGGEGSGAARSAANQQSSDTRDAVREQMLQEVGDQLADMRLRVRAEWQRLEVAISAQLELDPWAAMQPDVFIGLLSNRGPPGAVRRRDV